MSDSQPVSAAALPPEIAAWRDFCRRIEALGEKLLSPEFPQAPVDRIEGVAHLAEQVSCWLGWSFGHGDPRAPFFHRSNDLVAQWGGPNQDNAYHHARIDPAHRYRIRGKMHSCEDFVLTLRAGFMHMEVWGTQAAITASERGIRRGDDFEILLGGDGSDPAWTPIPAGVNTASLREYYLDWTPEEPAVFTIECLDEFPLPGRTTAVQVAERLALALAQTERSIRYWNEYLREHRAKGVDNQFALPMKVAKGLDVARYSFCFWDLAPDEALYVEFERPDARYWSLQNATLAWFETIDPVQRITSINQSQAVVDPDGRVRFALAHSDPGAPNWLDTGGRREGLCTLRWFWPRSDPTPRARVVRASELLAQFPAGTPRVAAGARAAEYRRRREHLAWRFHT
jgi:hypothetical protein